MATLTNAFEEEGLNQQIKQLESIMKGSPEFDEKVQGIIRRALAKARRSMIAHGLPGATADPNNAIQAIRTTVYRQILGGNINILQKKKAGKGGGSTGYGHRQRSERTIKLQSYYGSDRGFILRFLNSGTQGRVANNMNGATISRLSPDDRTKRKGGYKSDIIGYRGKLKAHNWLPQAAQTAMDGAAKAISDMIDQLIKERLA